MNAVEELSRLRAELRIAEAAYCEARNIAGAAQKARDKAQHNRWRAEYDLQQYALEGELS